MIFYLVISTRDTAYPLTPWKTRNQIERAFGRLKGRWTLLTIYVDFKIEIVSVSVSSCFVLHNFCKPKSNPDLDEEDIEKQIARDLEEQNNISFPDPHYSHNIMKSNTFGTCLLIIYNKISQMVTDKYCICSFTFRT